MNSQVFSSKVIFVECQPYEIIRGMGGMDYSLIQEGMEERYSVVSNCVKPALITAPG